MTASLSAIFEGGDRLIWRKKKFIHATRKGVNLGAKGGVRVHPTLGDLGERKGEQSAFRKEETETRRTREHLSSYKD